MYLTWDFGNIYSLEPASYTNNLIWFSTNDVPSKSVNWKVFEKVKYNIWIYDVTLIYLCCIFLYAKIKTSFRIHENPWTLARNNIEGDKVLTLVVLLH